MASTGRTLGLLLLGTVCLCACPEPESRPAPQPTSIEPAFTLNVEPLTVSISGKHFYVNATQQTRSKQGLVVQDRYDVTLIADDGELQIPLRSVGLLSSTKLTATVPADLPAKIYTVKVTGPSSTSGRLQNAFCVDVDNDKSCDQLDVCIDSDGDGLGNGSNANQGCLHSSTDLDDQDPLVCGDIDGDGCDDCSSGTFDPDSDGTDLDSDGFCSSGDCDDDPTGCGADCFPGNPAADLCDGFDQDCDGEVDEDTQRRWFQDRDGDGFTDGTSSQLACADPDGTDTGWVAAATQQDCDDDPEQCGANCFPDNSAPDICDGHNQDCDSQLDEDPDLLWFYDGDGDGFTGASLPQRACQDPDAEATHWVATQTALDCDDSPNTCGAECFPGNNAPDLCDGYNQDCDQETDEDPALVWFRDQDLDLFGDPNQATFACQQPAGYVEDNTDCADQPIADSRCNGLDGARCNPSFADLDTCDGADNDCDSLLDEDPEFLWFADSDGDGSGDPNVTLAGCSQPPSHVSNSDDCDDSLRYCDSDCTDLDQDTYCLPLDCDDTAESGSHCHDSCSTFFYDSDGDGFGNPALTVTACSATPTHVANSDDCDDNRSSCTLDCTNADGDDHCQPFDCDDSADTGNSCHQACLTYYADEDGDSFGDALTTTSRCRQPAGYVANADDCDDTPLACGADCNPDRSEGPAGHATCSDGHDNNCNGATDSLDPNCLGGAATCHYFTWATVSGSPFHYSMPENILNPPPSGRAYGTGGWAPGTTTAQFLGFGSGGHSETITGVSAVFASFLDTALSDDQMQVTPSIAGVPQGTPAVVSTAQLNRHIGQSGAGYTLVNLTGARSWVWSDFDGALELTLSNVPTLANDNVSLAIGGVGYRVDYVCNRAPTATLSVTPVFGPADTVFSFNATASSDAEDNPQQLLARWDWQGDGLWDTGFTTSKTLTHVYGSDGVFHVLVEIKDSSGHSAFASSSVVTAQEEETWVVDTAVDEDMDPGTGTSLREAIELANTSGQTSVIVLSSDLTILLDNGHGNLPKLDKDSIAIIGSSNTTIDGSLLNSGESECLKVDKETAHLVGFSIINCPRDGLLVDGDASTNIHMRRVTISGCGESGLRLKGDGDISIGPENNFSNNQEHGIFVDGNSADSFHISGNVVSGNIEHGIMIHDANDGFVEFNTIVGNQLSGICNSGNADNTTIRHNTLANNLQDGIYLVQERDGITLYNNLTVDNGGHGINATAGTYLGFDYNLYSNNGLEDCNNCPAQGNGIYMDPLFENSALGDYRLATGSPGIDSGIDLGIDVNGPASGNYSHQAPDIGAWEHL